MENLVNKVKSIFSNREVEIYELSDYIWNNPELGLLEHKSSQAIINLLKKEGFEIEENLSNMETAFIATYGNGGPVVGLSCEYDALPGLSQKCGVFEKKKVEGQDAGHGCGHNLLGTAMVGVALVLKDYIKENKIDATIKLLGTPSEERDAGKTFMGRDGHFDGLDFALSWHPMYFNAIWNGGSLAELLVNYTFNGISSHAAASPELGRSALDSCEIMNVGVNYLREHVTDDVRIHYAYLDSGGTAANVVHPYAKLHYNIRANEIENAKGVKKRVDRIAKGAAMMNGTEVDIEVVGAFIDYLPNERISEVLYESLRDFGLQEYDDKDRELAKNYFDTLDDFTVEQAIQKTKYLYPDTYKRLIDNHLVDELSELNEYKKIALPGSTDVGELSHRTPTAQMFLATAALGTPMHSWQMTGQTSSSIARKGLKSAVGGMSLCAIRVIEDEKILDEAKKEFKEKVPTYETPIPDELVVRDPKLVDWEVCYVKK